MNKTVAKKVLEVLNTYQKQMTANEMAWVIFQIMGNVSLDTVRSLVAEWYAKGKVGDATKWISKF